MKRWASTSALVLALSLEACAPRRIPTVPPPEPDLEPPAPAAPAEPEKLPVRREPAVRVGLLVDTAVVEVSSGTPFVVENAATGETLARVESGEKLRLTPSASGGVRIVGSSTVGAIGGAVLLRPDGEGLLQLGATPYRGTVVVQPSRGGKLTAINVLDMESYLLGVVPREIGKVGPELLETAKAQAVAARTYAVRYLGRRESLGFDVFATVQDQVYGGAAAEHEPVSRAVRETAGEILVYGGAPIEAFYHSTCAGHTAAIEEVWNEAPRPYLRSLVDVDPRTGIAYDSSSSRFRWTERWSADQLARIFDRTLADSLPGGRGSRPIDEIRDLRVRERTQSGRVRAMDVTVGRAGALSTVTIGGDKVRWILLTPKGAPLNSSKFDIEVVRNASGRATEIIASGGGWGHGIGMCQVGAMGRARAGQDYRTILQTYYPGTEIRDLY